MKDQFLQLEFFCNPELSEILIAELNLLGFDSFLEKDTGFQCSVSGMEYDKNSVDQLVLKYNTGEFLNYTVSRIADQDWNEEWENNFKPVIVENKIRIRAPYHPSSGDFLHEIIILPKRAFGTGHHETTSMMITAMMDLDFRGMRILDVGCGTGILSVLAQKMEAGDITGIDIDHWSVENALINISLNNAENIKILQTSVDALPAGKKFNIILANINRNVLLNDMRFYAEKLFAKGVLILSGFYDSDLNTIEKSAGEYNFSKIREYARNHWIAIVFEKKTD